MDPQMRSNLGPLAALAGKWQGAKGRDDAPSDDRGTEVNANREQLVLAPFEPVDNHEQQLWGLRYATAAFRLGEADAFHEETGYWLWDASAHQVMPAFIGSRGIRVLAGGEVAADARRFMLVAEFGSPIVGICSNPFLDREFQTLRWELDVPIHDDGSFSDVEDTRMRMPGRAGVFHHRDRNTLQRID